MRYWGLEKSTHWQACYPAWTLYKIYPAKDGKRKCIVCKDISHNDGQFLVDAANAAEESRIKFTNKARKYKG